MKKEGNPFMEEKIDKEQLKQYTYRYHFDYISHELRDIEAFINSTDKFLADNLESNKKMKIYHNPMCSKSRQALAIVKKNTSRFEIVEYLKNPLTFEEIKVLLPKLNIKAHQLVRTQEAIWKENYKGKRLTNNEIINIMARNPKLIERPIAEHNNKAVIGRPPENILNLFT